MMIVMSEADLAERGSDCEQRSPVVGGADTAWSGMLKPLRGRSRGKGERKEGNMLISSWSNTTTPRDCTGGIPSTWFSDKPG